MVPGGLELLDRIGVEVGYGDFRQLVDLAHDHAAGNHLREANGRALERRGAIVGVAHSLHADEHREAKADPLESRQASVGNSVARD